MTKELARNILTEHIRLMGDEPSLNEDKEALSMAIQALSQEPCDDAISREAVKELIKCGVSTDTYDDVEQVCKWIDALPSVTQKSGKWIAIDEEPHEDYECDKCGYVVSTFTANIKPSEEYKYCPNCGAKMFEPQESEG